jgi:RNA-directed DNA polymerase
VVKPILSLRDLSRRLGTSLETLDLLATNIKSHYHTWSSLSEKTHKVRVFRAPNPELMRILKRVNSNILAEHFLDESAHGGLRGRSPRTNAEQHLAKSLVITMDVRSFFPKVRHAMVYRMFRHDMGFGRDVARLLTRLTTLDAQLPQGAPTSGTIANILLTNSVDSQTSKSATAIAVVNTRYIDDLAFSGPRSRALINDTAKALSRKRLPIWRNRPNRQGQIKLKIMPRCGPQMVTGLLVNSKRGPSVPRKYRDAVRAAIHQLSKLERPELSGALSSIRGKIRYVATFNPGAACRLSTYLNKHSARPTNS